MKKVRCYTEVLIILAALFIAETTPLAFASGFAIFTHNATATGLAGSVIAHSNSPSSIFYNPALINRLEGAQFELGTTLLLPTREFESNTSGLFFNTKKELFYPSTFYFTQKVNKHISVGIGVFNNFGLATRWDDDWEGRYLADNSELTVFTFNPAISVKPTSKLAIAVGLDVMKIDTTLEKDLNLDTLPDAHQKFQGNGYGMGYNLGILWDVSESVSLGASYRSRVKTEIKGNVTHSLPSGTEPLIGGLFPNTQAETELPFPAQLQVGAAFDIGSHLTFESGFRFEEWSCYKDQRIVLSQAVAGVTSSVSEKNWGNTFSFNAGADFRIVDSFSLLIGYLYSGNPVPDETFDPVIPDSNSHVISTGAEFRYKSLVLGLSYGYQRLEDRVKSNYLDDNPADGVFAPITSANGKYNTNLQMAGISLAFKF